MISKMMPAVAMVALMLASGCTIRTGEAANRPNNQSQRRSPPPPPPKKKAEPRKAEPKKADPTPAPEPRRADPTPTPTPPVPVTDDPTFSQSIGVGWEKLGEATANGKGDHDVVTIGRNEGKFSSIRLRVRNSNVKMQDVVVHFANGEKFSPATRVEFQEGSVSRPIDLPGAKRSIKSVNFKYSDSSGSGAGTVEVWGKK